METFLKISSFLLIFSLVVNAQKLWPKKITTTHLQSTNIQMEVKDDTTLCFYKRKAEWQKIIDEYWGPGLPTSTKLQIFDTFWNLIDREYAGFPYLSVNWDSMKAFYRPKVAAGVSRGRFNAIMCQLYFPLREVHTYIGDIGIDSTFMPRGGELIYKPGVPVFWTHGWGPVGNFGAAITPLPDSSLLVYRAISPHPLGIVPGDIVLGYEGVPWKRLYKELLSAELPFEWWYGPYGSTEKSLTHSLLNSAGNNWGLFDTVDVVKYATGDTVHLPTAPLTNLDWNSLFASDQVPIAGVQMPNFMNGEAVRWGIIDNIGYVYVYDWQYESSIALKTALNDLINVKDVTGLILDFRFNLGTWGDAPSNEWMSYLFSEVPGNSSQWQDAIRQDPSNHLKFSYQIPQQMFFTPRSSYYDRPIAVLTGPHARSMGDDYAFRMRFHPMVRFFGLPTNGSFPAFGYVPYVEGAWGVWYYQHATAQMKSLINNEGFLMHKAFPVDEEVWLTPDGVAKGEDDVVKAALNWINNYTNVQDHNNENLVTNYALEQNYPNPFNSSTVIRYEIPGQARNDNMLVTLKVYDVLGREVATLVDEHREAGRYEVTFDASNLSSGLYFYQLRAGKYVETRKMVLIK